MGCLAPSLTGTRCPSDQNISCLKSSRGLKSELGLGLGVRVGARQAAAVGHPFDSSNFQAFNFQPSPTAAAKGWGGVGAGTSCGGRGKAGTSCGASI